MTGNLVMSGANIAFATATNSGIYWGGTGLSFIYSPATNVIVLGTASSEKIRIDASGNVGIGTSSPDALLTVNTIASFGAGSASAPSIAAKGDLNTGIFFPAADTIAATTGGTERMRIDGIGRVGIGTSSPDYLLTLQTGDAAISMKDTGGTTRAYIGTAGIFGSAPTGALRLRSDQGGIVFGYSGSETMRIDSSGNVGIGTTSPATKLDVNGFIRVNSGHSYQYYGPSGASDQKFWDSLSDNTSGNTLGFRAVNDAYSAAHLFMAVTRSGYQPQVITFYTGASSERMRITSGGSLFLGTTAAVAVTCRMAIRYTGGGTEYGIEFQPQGNGAYSLYFLNAAGSFIGGISNSSTATTYNTGSDYRLKKNITPLTGAAARVQALKPYRFNFIAEPSRVVDGFLAHEASDVVPEAVTGAKDAVNAEGKPLYQGMDHSKLVPLLTAALQEALTEIASLKARVAVLEATP